MADFNREKKNRKFNGVNNRERGGERKNGGYNSYDEKPARVRDRGYKNEDEDDEDLSSFINKGCDDLSRHMEQMLQRLINNVDKSENDKKL